MIATMLRSPLLRFLLRKMWNNRWLTFSTWLGLTVAVAFTASIPIYKDASLMRLIDTSLEELERGGGAPPGALQAKFQAGARQYTEPEALRAADAYVRERLPARVGFDHEAYFRTWSLRSRTVTPDEAERSGDGRRRQLAGVTQTGLLDEIELTAGRGWSEEGIDADGAIEAIVWEGALAAHDMRIGETYRYTVQTPSGEETYRVRIVGSFRQTKAESPYWQPGTSTLNSAMYMKEETFVSLLEQDKANLSEAGWYYAFDLSELRAADLSALGRELARIEPELSAILPGTRVDVGFAELVAGFRRQSVQLEASLFMLAAPMLAIVLYYVFMNARQSLNRQRMDIAVLRSRGGSASQLLRVFLYEGLLLGMPALAAGLAGAWGMARAIGSTDGFLRFVVGKEAALSYSPAAFAYGTAAVLATIAAATIPVWRYARTSIVGNRREQARLDRPPIWQRLYLDLALLAAAAYGWYVLQSQTELLAAASDAGSAESAASIPTYLFYVPAFAVWAGGLCFLRVFPPLIRLLHAVGHRRLPVSLHLSLLTLSRSIRAAYPLMLLLILTLGLGSYHASAARTIDANGAQKLIQAAGADVVLQPVWEGYEEEYDESGERKEEGESKSVIYTEPPFGTYLDMAGVRHAAQVLTEEGELSVASRPAGKGVLMGIRNDDFARAASWQEEHYPFHPYRYLRLLGAYEQAALVSEAFAAAKGLKVGDALRMTVRQTPLDFIVVGIVPLWPSLDPNEAPFVVANLDYIYDRTPLVPYQVWLAMEPDAKVAPVLQALQEADMAVASVRDVRSELIRMRLAPSREGVFGILSLGFLISAMISFVGYLLYWIFALSQRTVQLGILRATGLGSRQVTVMLLVEQLLTTGVSIAVGLLAGKLAGRLFLPFLQAGSSRQIPPFAVVSDPMDTVRLLCVVLAMLGLGAIVLVWQIRGMRVHQAVKMGEER
jgi:putative ABC transport system permease protein